MILTVINSIIFNEVFGLYFLLFSGCFYNLSILMMMGLRLTKVIFEGIKSLGEKK